MTSKESVIHQAYYQKGLHLNPMGAEMGHIPQSYPIKGDEGLGISIPTSTSQSVISLALFLLQVRAQQALESRGIPQPVNVGVGT